MDSRSAAKNSPARLLALFLLAASSGWAVDWKALKPEGYISDFAHVIDPQSRAALDQYAANIEKATGAQMAFVTVDTLQGEPVEDVANDLFHAWGIGQKNKDNGILLLLVTQDRRSRLEIGNGLEEILPDGFDGLLLENMRPELRANQYGPAMLTAAQAIGEVIAKARGVTVPAPSAAAAPAHRRVIQHRREVPWIPILFGLFIFWTLLRSSGRGGGGGGGGFWTGMLLGNLLNNVSYSGRGGGGFGGYDSGGSGGGFGGFGGGDSGGGGASSDW
jgi:uncharacterized protein